MYNQSAHALGANRSLIRELFEYGRQRAAEIGPENVLDFTLGNPSIPAPPEVAQAILQNVQELDPLQLHGYTFAAGDLAARKAIAEDLNSRFQAGASPENLFLTCGAAPALCAVFRALAVAKSEILAIAPYFPDYSVFVTEAGAAFQVIPPAIPSFQIDLQAVEAAIAEHTVALILNSPNNPSGTVYSRKTLEDLAALLRRKAAQVGHPIYIVSDEPYRELAYDGVEVPFLPAIYENTIVCYSYSKSLSLPGERIGYVYVPKQAADSESILLCVAGASRAMGHVCAPSLWQKVITRCAGLQPDLNSYDRNRRTLYEGLISLGYEVAKPEGAFYLFVKAPGGDAVAFCQQAKAKNLLVVPGDAFGCPGYFRVSYCVSHRTIQKSLPVFSALI